MIRTGATTSELAVESKRKLFIVSIHRGSVATQQRSGETSSKKGELKAARRHEEKFGECLFVESIFTLTMTPPEVKLAACGGVYYMRRRNSDGSRGPLVATGAMIGKDFHADPSTVIGPLVTIRSGTRLGRENVIYGNTEIGYNCSFADGVKVFDAIVGDGVHAGSNTRIGFLPPNGTELGTEIGDGVRLGRRDDIANAFVGAGSVIGDESVIRATSGQIFLGERVTIGPLVRLEDSVSVTNGSSVLNEQHGRVRSVRRIRAGTAIDNFDAQKAVQEMKATEVRLHRRL